jgi:hypothetical protein
MRSETFNPKMIFYQIIVIQSIFYFSFVGSSAFISVLFGFSLSLSSFFDYSQYSLDHPFLTVMLWAALCLVAFLLPRVIERTRKCLDFVLTLVIVHLCITWIVSGFPSQWSWWFVWAIGAAGCTLLAEYLCLREERREIRLGNTEKESEAVELGRSSA